MAVGLRKSTPKKFAEQTDRYLNGVNSNTANTAQEVVGTNVILEGLSEKTDNAISLSTEANNTLENIKANSDSANSQLNVVKANTQNISQSVSETNLHLEDLNEKSNASNIALEIIKENSLILSELVDYLRVISNPSYVDKTANQMRAQVTGSVTASGTVAVSSLASLTAVDGYQGRQLMLNNNSTAWAQTVLTRIT